jgi:peptidoglycan/LPS O-acetylase OafA/YrhL
MGILFAKYDWLTKTKERLREHFKINAITSMAAIAAMVVLRQKVTGESLDMLYAPALTICVVEISRLLPIISRTLMAIGKHSTTIWLTHTFWCYYFYPVVQVVVWPRYAAICYTMLLVISYAFALLFDGFWGLTSRVTKRLSRSCFAK